MDKRQQILDLMTKRIPLERERNRLAFKISEINHEITRLRLIIEEESKAAAKITKCRPTGLSTRRSSSVASAIDVKAAVRALGREAVLSILEDL